MKIQIDMDKYANAYPLLKGKEIKIQVDRRSVGTNDSYEEVYCYYIDGPIHKIPLYIAEDFSLPDQLDEFVQSLHNHLEKTEEQENDKSKRFKWLADGIISKAPPIVKWLNRKEEGK